MNNSTTKPYLLRALYEWCVDQGFTPYVAVVVDHRTVVPRQYVKDGQIVLNVGPEAVHQLVMGNDMVTCSARFGGVAQNLSIPVEMVAAIYARENGHGMAFEVNVDAARVSTAAMVTDVPALPQDSELTPETPVPNVERSARTSRGNHLRRIK